DDRHRHRRIRRRQQHAQGHRELQGRRLEDDGLESRRGPSALQQRRRDPGQPAGRSIAMTRHACARLFTYLRLIVATSALSSLLLAWTVGPAVPARAAGRPAPLPSTRLQLVVNKIIVHDDRDWGEGEISITIHIYECASLDDIVCAHDLVTSTIPEFTANDGSRHQTNWSVPAPGDEIKDRSIG